MLLVLATRPPSQPITFHEQKANNAQTTKHDTRTNQHDRIDLGDAAMDGTTIRIVNGLMGPIWSITVRALLRDNASRLQHIRNIGEANT